ncbi:MAG: FtsX-like permease family protein [Bacillota bacterium]|nr:FtsX-like permease family protein [Bacillota bacterium]
MRLDSIAINNIKRRKWKMAFIVLGIALAVSTIVTLYSATEAMNQELADRFDEIGANIMIVPNVDNYALSYGGITVASANVNSMGYLHNDDVIKINNIPEGDNIATVAPKTLAYLEIEGSQLLTVGVDFPMEMRLKKWWTYEGDSPKRIDHVMLGANIATKLGVSTGDEIEVEGETYTVTAVLHPQGSEDDGLVFMQLLTVQRLADLEDKLSMIEVAAYCTTCPLPEIVEQIREALPNAKVTALKEAVQAREDIIDNFSKFAMAVAVVVFFIGSLVVTITMMSSVNERTKEIGIFRAIGFRKSNVVEIILTEAIVLGTAGGIAGYLVGILAAKFLAPTLAGMQVTVTWNPILGISTVVGAIVLGLITSAYPAIKAAKLDPVEALRYI